MKDVNDNIIYGRNPVLEAMSSGKEIDKILIQKDIEGAGKKIYAMAKKSGILLQAVDRSALNRLAGSTSHQGVIAYVSEFEYCDIDDILSRAETKGEEPFIVLLDGIEDPQNLGAIIRSADGAGVHGVVIPKNRAASVTSAAQKASAGATVHMPVSRVSNIVSIIAYLKEKGLWIYGLDMAGEDYSSQDYRGGVALVIGSEGSGLSRLVKEKCDKLISLPMRGAVASLNASASTAIALYEIAKTR